MVPAAPELSPPVTLSWPVEQFVTAECVVVVVETLLVDVVEVEELVVVFDADGLLLHAARITAHRTRIPPATKALNRPCGGVSTLLSESGRDLTLRTYRRYPDPTRIGTPRSFIPCSA